MKKSNKIETDHLLNYFDGLSKSQQQALEKQILSLDHKALLKQKNFIETIDKQKLSPFTQFEKASNNKHKELGQSLIEEGKVGCLLIAGGQGTRLNFKGPKGLFPISVIKHKTLYQLFAEKTLAASKQANSPLQLAIMTSPLNDAETKTYFQKNEYFGLNKDQIDFYTQSMLPLLDKSGKLFLETPYQIAMGPDGNGNSLKNFVKSGLYQKWKEKGIEYLNYVLIDNPLAEPFDPELVGYQNNTRSDIVIKCVERKDPDEKVGVIIQKNQKPAVIEYTELPQEERIAKKTHHLKHRLANISLFSFSMNFVKKAENISLPLHRSFKAVDYLDKDGQTKRSDKPIAWKYETFIFDLLPYAEKVSAFVYKRDDCFAPLKNAKGYNSPDTVQQALLNKDKKIFESIAGEKAPESPFELSQQFYYPTALLLKKWHGRKDKMNNYPYIKL